MKWETPSFDDILNSFDIEAPKTNTEISWEEASQETLVVDEISLQYEIQIQDEVKGEEMSFQRAEKEEKSTNTPPTKRKVQSKPVAALLFLIRYITTSSVIFVVLLVSTNFSAYYSLLHGYIFSDSLERSKESLISSVEAGSISISDEEYQQKAQEIDTNVTNRHSIKQLISGEDEQSMLNIDITPYEDRIIIPKIGKNIPLLDIKQQTVAGHNELEDIFMKELENGVIRYPGSAKPGQSWNTFIFWHSSNYPWLPGQYNDVFALLDYLENGDKIIVYYKQKKFVYEIQGKKVIKPGDISVLKTQSADSELSVMTCWPVGTALNRLVVNAKLVSQE